MIAFLVLLLLTAILAYFDAKREDGMIYARPGGPDLDHKELVWRRIRNVGALVMVAVVCDGTDGWDALWMGLCHAGGAWAMFVLVHRLSLNLRRGMDWRYVSPGNHFDNIWIVSTMMEEHSDDVAYMLNEHARIYNSIVGHCYVKRKDRSDLLVSAKWYRDQIHKAGKRSYIAIALVLAASVVGAIVILTNT